MMQKNRQRKQKQKTGKRPVITTTWVVTAFALICSVLCAVYYNYQLQNYENGVIEVYADQQDSYVQLVLDQINLMKSRSDMEIIQDILGTLDASTNKYWTMAKNETLVFVRDVTETSRYRGVMEDNYYISDSAKIFINNLNVNYVNHQIIEIGDRDYVASGVKFIYNGEEYQICLMTNPDTILDHNAYLGAKINLTIMMGLILAIFLIVSIALGLRIERANRSQALIERENIQLRRAVEKLNNSLVMQEMYDTRTAVFHSNLLPMLMDKICEKNAVPVVLLMIKFEDRGKQEVFLEGSQITLGKKYLRFRIAQNQILLVGIRCTKDEMQKAASFVIDTGGSIIDSTEFDSNLNENLTAYTQKWGLE